mmetsp:Transcript_37031/g.85494  ORF Transcript_37031/g.85494 Transcript_37031/m.85494 type:complete len:135 (+) Transcript_37031:30-434(+)
MLRAGMCNELFNQTAQGRRWWQPKVVRGELDRTLLSSLARPPLLCGLLLSRMNFNRFASWPAKEERGRQACEEPESVVLCRRGAGGASLVKGQPEAYATCAAAAWSGQKGCSSVASRNSKHHQQGAERNLAAPH